MLVRKSSRKLQLGRVITIDSQQQYDGATMPKKWWFYLETLVLYAWTSQTQDNLEVVSDWCVHLNMQLMQTNKLRSLVLHSFMLPGTHVWICTQEQNIPEQRAPQFICVHHMEPCRSSTDWQTTQGVSLQTQGCSNWTHVLQVGLVGAQGASLRAS